jgi:hypothetical protein
VMRALDRDVQSEVGGRAQPRNFVFCKRKSPQGLREMNVIYLSTLLCVMWWQFTCSQPRSSLASEQTTADTRWNHRETVHNSSWTKTSRKTRNDGCTHRFGFRAARPQAYGMRVCCEQQCVDESDANKTAMKRYIELRGQALRM